MDGLHSPTSLVDLKLGVRVCNGLRVPIEHHEKVCRVQYIHPKHCKSENIVDIIVSDRARRNQRGVKYWFRLTAVGLLPPTACILDPEQFLLRQGELNGAMVPVLRRSLAWTLAAIDVIKSRIVQQDSPGRGHVSRTGVGQGSLGEEYWGSGELQVNGAKRVKTRRRGR